MNVIIILGYPAIFVIAFCNIANQTFTPEYIVKSLMVLVVVTMADNYFLRTSIEMSIEKMEKQQRLNARVMRESLLDSKMRVNVEDMIRQANNLKKAGRM